MIVLKGSADITTYVNLVDSTAGTPETGLTITAIDATYTRMRAAAVKNDLTALAAVDSAHTDNKAIEVDATNAPGLYRIDWPDAAFLTGADKVILSVTCSGVAPAHLICSLVNYNDQDGVRMGLTALPNAAADAAGGLPISDAGGLDMDAILSRIGTPANLGGGTATLAGNMVDIEAQTDDIGAAGAGLTAVPWNSAWDAEVQSEVDDALVVHRLDELVNADSDIDGAAPPTVGSVFHELMSKTAGSFTYDQTTDSLEAVRDKETDIETDTQDIQARIPAALVSGRIDASVGAVAANAITAAAIATGAIDADAVAADAVTEIQAGLSTLTAANVNAEVVDALNVDTYAEIGQEAPAATQTIRKMLGYLYKAWRNKSTQDATTYKLYNDDAATVDQKATCSDDSTTFTRGEAATGP